MRNSIALLVLLRLGQASGPAGGQTPTASQARQYQLTLPRANHLIAALQAMTQYVVALPDFQDRVVKTMHMTPAERRAQLEMDPKAMAILRQNDLTAQEYLVGVPALRMALMAAQHATTSANVIASPANVAFARAHLAELKPKMDAADGVVRPR
jgi:DNA-binding MarR family transcriptional regulator